eukprot:NODE_491_length_790_cov_460.090498_g482_i0.p1 GENE.NODE_491_length_790_cov_460.090498_g482_i0~~NODE_491_length_790_cov_460.090498_g482_i0.p1  ORF type:complete len:64 (-),score=12.71 NODE_491_length_790_cov_460.090498_g482_i0:518-709(-)
MDPSFGAPGGKGGFNMNQNYVPDSVVGFLVTKYSKMNNKVATLEQKNLNLKASYTAAQREYAS